MFAKGKASIPMGPAGPARRVLGCLPVHFLAIFLAYLTLAGVLDARLPVSESLPSGAKLYVAPMEWSLDQFIVAEIRKQGLPVEIVASAEQADFVMTGLHQVLSSRLMSAGHYIQVRVFAAGDGKQVWFAETNDYALFFGRLRCHGQGRAAGAIVRKLRYGMTGLAR
jgi:hypothetical protein